MWHGAPYTRVNPFFSPLFRPRTFFLLPFSQVDPRILHVFRQFCVIRTNMSLGRRNYTSVDWRIPGRRDACTDCVGLAAPSSESTERRRDARRDGTRSTRMAQARRTVRYRFSSFPLILLALYPFPFPLAPHSLFLSLSRLLSFFLSRPIVRAVGYNIQFIMYLWYMRTAAPEKWEARMHSSHRLPASPSGEK